MLYAFDNSQKLLKAFGNDAFIEMHLEQSINAADELTATAYKENRLPDRTKYLAVPLPNQKGRFSFLQVNDVIDKAETVEYQASEMAFSELSTYKYIKDVRPANRPTRELAELALHDTPWTITKCNMHGRYTTNFYYISPFEALKKVLEIAGGEITFYVVIDGNKITGRYVEYLEQQGSDNGYRFEYGQNLVDVSRSVNSGEIYTAIVPRGKGELIESKKPNTPDGYGRRITIADVAWSKQKGAPLDKPKGSEVLIDPNAQSIYGQIDGSNRYLVHVFEDIEDPELLIHAGYKKLKEVNHVQVEYQAQVVDGNQLNLGDTVVVKRNDDRNLDFKTRIFKAKYDLLNPTNAQLSLGDDLSSRGLESKLKGIDSKSTKLSDQLLWSAQSSDGTRTFRSEVRPDKAKEGDIWYKLLPNGEVEIYRFESGEWTLVLDPATAERIKNEVAEALKNAQDYADQLNQKTQANIGRVEGVVQENAMKTDAGLKKADGQINSANQKISDVDGQIKLEIQNRLAGEGAILDKTDSKITAAVKDKADISYVDMRANGILASVQSTNLVENSEFQYDDNGVYYGWTLNSLPIDNKTFRPNGMRLLTSSQYQGQSQTVVYNGKPDKIEWLSSPKLQVQAGTHLTASLAVVVRDTAGLVSLSISAYDANGQKLNRYYQDITKQWEWQTYQIETDTPAGTQYVQFELAVRGTIFITQPFLGIQPKWTGYSIGKAGVNSSLMITNDRITSTVKDYTGKIATLNQRVDGFDMKVSNTNSQLESLRTQTSDLIAQEVRNRENGDVSILSQAKNAITLAVQDKVTKSELAVTTEGILATVQTVNLLSNSEFDLANNKIYGWYSGAPAEKWLPLDGTLPFGNNAFWPKARNFIGDKTRYQYPTTKLYHDDTMDDVGATHWLKSEPVSVRPNEVIETSIEGLISSNSNAELDPVISLRLVFYDSDKKVLSEKSVTTRIIGTAQTLRLSGSINDGLVRGVGIAVGVRGKVDLSRPQLTSGTGTDKTYTPTKMGAGAVLSLSTDSFALGIKNNADKIISGINGDESGIKLTGNKILLDGNVTANGDFWAKQVNAVKINASNILAGTLDASKINVLNLNASQITTGTLDGNKVHISNGKNSLFVDAGGISVSTRDTLNGNEQPIIQIQTLNRQVWLGSAGATNVTKTYGNLSLQGANFRDGKPITNEDWQEVMNVGYLTKDRKIMLPTGMYFNPSVADLIGMGRRERAFADFSIDKSGDAEMQFNLRVGGVVNIDGHGMKVERLWPYDGAPSLQLTVYNLDGVKRPGIQLSGGDNNIGLAFGPGALYTVYNGKYTKLA
ncbi:phage tail spike protein [Weissella viridescens]